MPMSTLQIHHKITKFAFPIMPVPWFSIAVDLPIDGATVYIHRLMDSLPIIATWDLTTAMFTLDTGLSLPWYFVRNWRSL